MSGIRVCTTENAGAVLWLGGLCVWADVLNEENPDGYEVLSEAHFSRLLTDPAFRPDLLVFTHRHPDHFSEARLFRTLEAFPEARVFIGGEGNPGDLGPDFSGSPALRISAIPLPHEGKAYENVENDALLLRSEDGTVLLSGDCPVGCPELLTALAKETSMHSESAPKGLTLALLNFPWLSLGKGRKALLSLDPAHALFFHLPAPGDDVYGYRLQAERMLERFGGGHDYQIVRSPFSEYHFPSVGKKR